MSTTSPKVYEGKRTLVKGWAEEVTVNGQPLRNYYPQSDGFEWGYKGGGPRALALSILCDHFGFSEAKWSEDGTVKKWQYYWIAFLTEVISKFSNKENFRLTSQEIATWIATKEPFIEGSYEMLQA